ncbi:MAG: hypothetical protein IKO99_08445 [Bacteroidales bacterium]|jgi:hypothetical protein|nr:hypothetical protein [Bacteroidales bacterium]
MEFLRVFIVVLVILALCFLGLGIQIFFSKKKRFPQYEVGENEEMQKRGIYCMHQLQQMIDNEIIYKNKHANCEGCALRTENCGFKKS